MMKIKIVTLISITVVLSLISCVEDNLFPQVAPGEVGELVNVELSFKIPPVKSPQGSNTRSTSAGNAFSVEFFNEPSLTETRAEGATELYNLWLFQFHSGGEIHGKPQQVTDQVHMVNDKALLPVSLHVGADQTLYLVALGKKVTATSDLAGIQNIKELENLSLNYIENRNGLYYCSITNESEVPYAGKASGLTVRKLGDSDDGEIVYGTPDGFSGGIEVKRLVARIQIKHKFDLTQNTLEGLRLLKIPSMLFVNPSSVATDVLESVSMVDLEDAHILTDADKDADGFYTSQWYVAQNKRSSSASDGITTERDRYRKVSDDAVVSGAAPELGTNIEVWSYAKTDRKLYTIHQIYVGNNNTNNFDVELNSYYNLRTIINSGDTNDGRIRAYTALQKIYFSATSYQVMGGGKVEGTYPTFFDAHYGWRPIIVYAQGRKVTVGIYSDANYTQLVDMNNPTENWLQLSTYPNYTEAVRNGKETALTNQIETSIFLPTRFKLYLYADEYITNEDGSITDYQLDKTKIHPFIVRDHSSFLKTRTLYVKVVTEEITAEGTKKDIDAKFTLSQKQGYYAGLFGGDLENGQYTQGLIVDAVNEREWRIDDKYPGDGFTSRTLFFGYSTVLTPYSWSKTATEEDNYHLQVTGKQATYNYATNPNNYTVNANLTTQFSTMRKINGNIDLYQYDYYKTFSARFCFDLNRDKNGNGKIDYLPNDPVNNEYEWYLPSVYQGMGIRVGAGNIFFEEEWATAADKNSSNSSASTILGAGWQPFSTGKTAAKAARCVRNIPVSDKRKEGTKVTTYTTDKGDTYVMIDISNLPNGVTDRSTPEGTSEIYEELDLYSYSTTGIEFDPTKPTIVDSSKPRDRKVKRVVKNMPIGGSGYPLISRYIAADFSSQKFIVSPTDVYNDGDTKPNDASTVLGNAEGTPQKNNINSTWAEANGRLNTANTQGYNLPSQATETGCYAYRGKSGTDDPGTWRVPNHRELSMILIFERGMEKLEPQTGFKKLYMLSDPAGYSPGYWASTMSPNTTPEAMQGAICRDNYALSVYHRGAMASRIHYLRCIKDVK